MSRVLFIKPPDRFLENEFTFQQLGPHFLQSYLKEHGIQSDILVLYEPDAIRNIRKISQNHEIKLSDLNMLLLKDDGISVDAAFDETVLESYDVIGFSVMSPQAPDAYLLNEVINERYPRLTTVIGGSHARYYLTQLQSLPESKAFDFIVPQDGWEPLRKIATGEIKKRRKSVVISEAHKEFENLPAPTRPLPLMEKYRFEIAGVPAFHTITALGCPFTCRFCESGRESVRRFSEAALDADLNAIKEAHQMLGRDQYAVMFFDDVGLMSPKQVQKLSSLVAKHGFTTWRAFTHAYLVVKHGERLLGPFHETGGRRIGVGLETGSQRSLDLINKRNGQFQDVETHFKAVEIANAMGIAVDVFTMIYPWENEEDLKHTTRMIEYIVNHPVNGLDEKGRPLKNHVDSTIMMPYEGTEFRDMMITGSIPGVELIDQMDPADLFYKGLSGGSGWPYKKTVLPQDVYLAEQKRRNALRPEYR